jgi:hypothetical protein
VVLVIMGSLVVCGKFGDFWGRKVLVRTIRSQMTPGFNRRHMLPDKAAETLLFHATA